MKQLLETLHSYRHEGYRCVVVEAVYTSLCVDGKGGGGLQTGENSGMSQGEFEEAGEDPCQALTTAPGMPSCPSALLGDHRSESSLYTVQVKT